MATFDNPLLGGGERYGRWETPPINAPLITEEEVIAARMKAERDAAPVVDEAARSSAPAFDLSSMFAEWGAMPSAPSSSLLNLSGSGMFNTPVADLMDRGTASTADTTLAGLESTLAPVPTLEDNIAASVAGLYGGGTDLSSLGWGGGLNIATPSTGWNFEGVADWVAGEGKPEPIVSSIDVSAEEPLTTANLMQMREEGDVYTVDTELRDSIRDAQVQTVYAANEKTKYVDPVLGEGGQHTPVWQLPDSAFLDKQTIQYDAEGFPIDPNSGGAEGNTQQIYNPEASAEQVYEDYNNNPFADYVDVGAMGAQTEAMLNAAGLQPVYNVDELTSYAYNVDTGEYVYRKRDAPSFLDKVMPVLVTGILTAGVGAALAPAFVGVGGMGAAAASGTANALVSGAVTAAQGGDLKDVVTAGVLGGVGAYGKELDTAAKSVDAAGKLTATADVIARAETFNQITTTIDLVQAIESDNVLGAVSAGLSLTGQPAVHDFVAEKVLDNTDSAFITDNIDNISSGIVGAGEAIAKGEDFTGVISNTTNTIIKDNYLTERNVKASLIEFAGDNDFIYDNIDTITEGIIKGGREALDGENTQDIFIASVKPLVKDIVKNTTLSTTIGGGDLDIDLKAVEDFWQDNIEKPLEAFWQGIQPERELIENAVKAGVGYVKDGIIDPVLNTVKEIGQGAVDVAGEALSAVNREVVKPVLGAAEDLGKELLDAVPDVNLPSVSLPDIDLPSVSLPDVNLPSYDLPSYDLPDVDLPSFDLGLGGSSGGLLSEGELAKRRAASLFNIQDLSDYTGLENELLV